jgi:NADH-quinone oxidoreductase subunit N
VSAEQLTPLLPLLTLGGTAILLLLLIALRPSQGPALWVTGVGLLVAAVLAAAAMRLPPRAIGPLLIVDGLSLFYQMLLIAATLAVALLSASYLKRQGRQAGEFYVLLLLATLGASVLTSSRHFASFFLGLETLTISLYALIGYLRDYRKSTEAALKYLVLAGAASAVLLFGIALLYAQLGTLELGATAIAISKESRDDPLLIVGATLVMVGIGFKLAMVPLHWWTPDVYEGAPAPVTAYVATISKGAVFALLLRFLVNGAAQQSALTAVFWVFAAASMLGGNLLALLQNNVKRILAYSSIAHLGYATVAFLAGGAMAAAAVTFYLLAYFVTTLLAFGVVAVLSTQPRDADSIEDYRGLFRRNWPLALLFTVSLLSLAGIPLTAGFVAKFYVAAAGAGAALWSLLVILALSSAMGLYYYVRVIVAMISEPTEPTPPARIVPLMPAALLTVLLTLLVWLGIYPAYWQRLVSLSVESVC